VVDKSHYIQLIENLIDGNLGSGFLALQELYNKVDIRLIDGLTECLRDLLLIKNGVLENTAYSLIKDKITVGQVLALINITWDYKTKINYGSVKVILDVMYSAMAQSLGKTTMAAPKQTMSLEDMAKFLK
jgi:hypothetical protein